jgi:hypothetical protein
MSKKQLHTHRSKGCREGAYMMGFQLSYPYSFIIPYSFPSSYYGTTCNCKTTSSVKMDTKSIKISPFMGIGYGFTCSHCGYETKLMEGQGFRVHDQFIKEYLEDPSFRFHPNTHRNNGTACSDQ